MCGVFCVVPMAQNKLLPLIAKIPEILALLYIVTKLSQKGLIAVLVCIPRLASRQIIIIRVLDAFALVIRMNASKLCFRRECEILAKFRRISRFHFLKLLITVPAKRIINMLSNEE